MEGHLLIYWHENRYDLSSETTRLLDHRDFQRLLEYSKISFQISEEVTAKSRIAEALRVETQRATAALQKTSRSAGRRKAREAV